MSNSTKVLEENLSSIKHIGFESALFIPAKNKFEFNKEENYEEFNEFSIDKIKSESSNNLELNEAQKRNSLSNLNIHSFISQDLLKKIEESSPMRSGEAQKFGFIDLKITPRDLFDKKLHFSSSNNFENQNSNSNFFQDTIKANISRDDLEKFNSSFMKNPFLFDKAYEESNHNDNFNNIINETERNFGKFNSLQFENLNSIKKNEINNKDLNEELIISKLLESLNIDSEAIYNETEQTNNEIASDKINQNSENNSKKGDDLRLNKNENLENKNKDYTNAGQNSSTFQQNININNNFNYNIGNGVPYLNYYYYLMSLNPYLLNANLIFKINYLQKLQNYLMTINKNNKAKSNNFQFGRAGWTCMFCNNFNYEIRIKCNRCGKLPQNKKDPKIKEEFNSNNNNDIFQISNLYNFQKNINNSIDTISENSKKGINLNNSNTIYNLSDVNLNNKAFFPKIFKDSNILNQTLNTQNSSGIDKKSFLNSISIDNKKINNSPFRDNNLAQYRNENSYYYKNENLGFNSNPIINNICINHTKIYSSAVKHNQLLYNQNTPINKLDNCNSNYLNSLKNNNSDSKHLSINHNSELESEKSKPIDLKNKFNLIYNNNPQLRQKSNTTSDSTESQVDKKKKKPFVERIGDWSCFKCKNLNFSFRLACNRCQLTKAENERNKENISKNS